MQHALVRFIVMGAGAVGGVVGARLHQAGHEVVLLVRGAHLAAVQAKGLRFRSPQEDFVLPIRAVGEPGQIAWREDDVVLLAVKSQDTHSALVSVAGSMPPTLPVVCMQNGVNNERVALRRFRDVYGMCVMLPARHLEPGTVEAFSSPLTGMLDIGRIPQGVDDLTEECSVALGRSSLESVPRPSIMRWKYRKLIMNLANVIEALFEPSEAAGELIRRAWAEGEAVLEMAGIDVASRQEDAERRARKLQLSPVDGRAHHGSSWQSLARGAGSMETDYLNGEIALLGRLHGVATPTNTLLQSEGRAAIAKSQEPRTLNAASFLERLEADD